ncbi:unnamed protein product [Phytomonas sp. EM1]|nr:unnamed protein product [Phytomonas sp. EM1]|eukprot:CCW63601.1 unnamed protein product [Phytomonas sp. isolate EM1]
MDPWVAQVLPFVFKFIPLNDDDKQRLFSALLSFHISKDYLRTHQWFPQVTPLEFCSFFKSVDSDPSLEVDKDTLIAVKGAASDVFSG